MIILIYQFASQLMRIFRRCLPEKGGDVIIERSFPAALENYKITIPRIIELYDPFLKITIEERVGVF